MFTRSAKTFGERLSNKSTGVILDYTIRNLVVSRSVGINVCRKTRKLCM